MEITGFCPILWHAYISRGEEDIEGGLIECVKEECALFNRKTGKCGLIRGNKDEE